MNISAIKETVSIVDFLQRLGFEPKRKSGQEFFYLSPIRGSDTDPSFTVNDIQGKWYDHGEGKGGNIIDLSILLFEEIDLKNIVKKINNMYSGLDVESYDLQVKYQNETKEKLKKHEIIGVKPLGTNPAITSYLESRGVFQEASRSGLIQEVYYNFIDDKNKRTKYFGAGWKNDTGGYDIRNKYGKICINNKDILTIKGSTDRFVLFEGMMNYQSAIAVKEVSRLDNAIILNTTAFTGRVINILKNLEIKTPEIYFDNGKGGRKFTEMIKAEIPGAADKSYLYSGFDDFNEKHMSLIKQENRPFFLKR